MTVVVPVLLPNGNIAFTGGHTTTKRVYTFNGTSFAVLADAPSTLLSYEFPLVLSNGNMVYRTGVPYDSLYVLRRGIDLQVPSNTAYGTRLTAREIIRNTNVIVVIRRIIIFG